MWRKIGKTTLVLFLLACLLTLFFLEWRRVMRLRPPSIEEERTILYVPSGLAIFPDTGLLAVSSLSRVYFFDSITGEIKNKVLAFDEIIGSIASASQNTLLVGTVSGKMHIICIKTGKKTTIQAHRNTVLGIAVSPDSRLIATIGNDNLVFVWNRDSLEEYRCQPVPRPGPASDVRFYGDSSTLIYAGLFDSVEVWDLNSDSSFGLPVQPDSFVNSIAVSKCKDRLFVADTSKRLHCWDLRNNQRQSVNVGDVITCLESISEVICFGDIQGQIGLITTTPDLKAATKKDSISLAGIFHSTCDDDNFFVVTSNGTLCCWSRDLKLKWKYRSHR